MNNIVDDTIEKLQSRWPTTGNSIRVGKLIVNLLLEHRYDKHGKMEIKCSCLCSPEKSFFVRFASLLKKNPTQSCGCLRMENQKKRRQNKIIHEEDIMREYLCRKSYNGSYCSDDYYSLENYKKPDPVNEKSPAFYVFRKDMPRLSEEELTPVIVKDYIQDFSGSVKKAKKCLKVWHKQLEKKKS